MSVDLKRAERLRAARKAAGYNRPIDAITAFGFRRGTYFSHENGQRGIPRDAIVAYAAAYRVEQMWLLSGTGPMRITSRRIRIEGQVGDLGIIEKNRQQSEALNEIDPPPSWNADDFVAFRVTGDSNYPAWRINDVIVVSRLYVSPDICLGKRCVVTLPDGTRMVRELYPGTRSGRYLLITHAAPPIIDAEVIDASPVLVTMHAS